MARRTIKTVDGQVFSDDSDRFEDRQGVVLYREGFFKRVRIHERNITTDDMEGRSVAPVIVVGLLGLALFGLLSPRRSGENDTLQRNQNIARENSLTVIASEKSGLYYLPQCPGYERVKPQHEVRFDSEQAAQANGYRRARNCR
jgi:hypothetical protein